MGIKKILFFIVILGLVVLGVQAEKTKFKGYRAPSFEPSDRANMERRVRRGLASSMDEIEVEEVEKLIGRGKISRGKGRSLPKRSFRPKKLDEEFRKSISGADKTTVRTSDGKVLTCDSDEKYMPLSLLKIISEEGEGLTIESDVNDGSIPVDEKTVTVKIPSYLGGCARLRPKVHQDEGSNLIVVTVENDFPLDDFLLGRGTFEGSGQQKISPRVGVTGIEGNFYNEDDIKEMTHTEKLEACMTIKDLLVSDGKGGAEVNWPTSKGYKTTLAERVPVSFNPRKNMKIVYGSPATAGRDYGSAFEWDKKSDVSIHNPAKCLMLEELGDNGIFLYDDTDRRYVGLQEDCQGNFLDVLTGLKKVSQFAEKKLFKKILERELEKKLEVMAKDRYKRLEHLGKELSNPGLTREEAYALSQRYLGFIRELDNFYLRPKIDKLRKLVLAKERNSRLSSKEKKRIDEEILALNLQIGDFSKGEADKQIKSKETLANLRRLGLTEEALEIAEFKLYSAYYSRVYHQGGPRDKRGPKLTINDAQSKIHQDYGKYTKESILYDQAYRARTGQGFFSRQYAQRIKRNQELLKNSYSDYQRQEMKNREACSLSIIGSVRNPMKCKRVMGPKAIQHRQGMLMEKVKYYQKKINQEHDLYTKFKQLEDQAREKKMAERKKEQESRAMASEVSHMEDILDSSGAFNFDYEKFAHNESLKTDDDYSLFNERPAPSNSSFNRFKISPQLPMRPYRGVDSGPQRGGLQGNFPMGGYPSSMMMTPRTYGRY